MYFCAGPFIGTPVVLVISVCIYVAGLIQAGSSTSG